jgi:hypothetical protein
MSDCGLFIATYAFNGRTEPFVITMPAGCSRRFYLGSATSLTDGSIDLIGSGLYTSMGTGRNFRVRTIVNAEDAEMLGTGDGVVVATSVAPTLREVRLMSRHAETYELVGDHIDDQFRNLPFNLTTTHLYTEATQELD